MGQTRERDLSQEALVDQVHSIATRKNCDEDSAVNLNEAPLSIMRPAHGDVSPELEPQQQLELRRENEKLQLELKKLQQQVTAADNERELAIRLLQQQTRRIYEMQRQLAECSTQTQLMQKLLHSASWRITAPLRTAKLMLVRMLPSKR